MDETGIDDRWRKVREEFVDEESGDFRRAVEVWINKPHTVNRRLCGIKHVFDGIVSCQCHVNPLVTVTEEACCCHAVHLYERQIQYLISENEDSALQRLRGIVQTCNNGKNRLDTCTRTDSNKTLKFWIRKLLPKRTDKFDPVQEVVLLDDIAGWAVFIPSHQVNSNHYVTPPHLYGINWNETQKSIGLWVYNTPQEGESAIVWLQTHLLPRLKKWAVSQSTNSGGSLRLVPVDRYNELYQKLKIKHGPHLVQNWPERTDPSKFVYEDIAIATYLLLLWEQEYVDKKLKVKQSFLDLGCGNGLLVYILTKEGHPGAGLDIRKRKVWDMFGPEVRLQVSSITPSPETIYPEYDWLIGNHSDELTPWIPVMASRSKFTSRFFVLPCCAHDFDSKFQRVGSDVSQYRSYLDYVQQVAEVCGFEVEEDRLRIPSTKRICFLGMKRSYDEENESEIDKRRQEFILSRCKNVNELKPLSALSHHCTSLSDKKSDLSCDYTDAGESVEQHLQVCSISRGDISSKSASDMWATNFQARSAIELVRNCTRLNKDLVTKIVGIVTCELLTGKDNCIEIISEGGSVRKWNQGRRVHLSSLVDLVEKDDLKQLKNECGGLQTLIKNHSHIFAVYQGTVGFKNYSMSPKVEEQKPRRQKLPPKPKPCWFHHHHPHGCPVSEAKCKFIHGN